MDEKILSDEEIVKALEHCATENTCRGCVKYNGEPTIDYFKCMRDTRKKVVDLFHRLQDKIAGYERKLADGELVSKEWHDEQVLHDKAEIERLTAENKKLSIKAWSYEKPARTPLYSNESMVNCNFVTCYNENADLKAKNAELQKQVDKLKASDMSEMRDLFEVETDKLIERAHQQAVKDTAKEILDELLDIEVKDEDYEMFFLDVCEKLEKFAQKHGVEVE